MRKKRVYIVSILLALNWLGNSFASDTDHDFMTDDWELGFGLNPASASDAIIDTDNDGLTNEEEYITGHNPTVSDSSLTDAELLELTAFKAFLFFWKEAVIPQGQTVPILIPDHADFNGTSAANYHSIAGIGFALAALVVADDRGWVSHEEAYQRIYQTLSYFRAIQETGCYDNDPATECGNVAGKVKHGYLYHWYDINGSQAVGSEVSSIDHALFIAGALTAGQYYHGTPVEDLANQLYSSTEWRWMWDSSAGHLRQAWHSEGTRDFCPNDGNTSENDTENGCWNPDHWNRYSELMILLNLAIGPGENFDWDFDPNNGSEHVINIPSSTWQNISRQLEHYGNWPNDPAVPLPDFINAGSLHNHQYSHMYLDLKDRPDDWMRTNMPGEDYFKNSMFATLSNRAFTIDLKNHDIQQPFKYETYGDNVWGLSACNAYPSYQVLQAIFQDDPSCAGLSDEEKDNCLAYLTEINTDSGTVAPFAPLGSTPFTPSESVAALRHMYEQRNTFLSGQSIWGRYGFLNCFNSGAPFPEPNLPATPTNWWSTNVIGIDLGPIVGMIENYRTGLLWKYTHRSWIIKAGLGNMRFNSGYVQPSTISFNLNDLGSTNEYGGLQGSFGDGATASLTTDIPNAIADGGKSFQLSATQSGTGAWISLNWKPIHAWEGISFWIRGLNGTEAVDIGLKDVRDPNVVPQAEHKIPLSTFLDSTPTSIPTDWTYVEVPFEPFIKAGVLLPQMNNISFTFTSTGGTIQLDHIQFVEDVFPPSTPTGFQVQYVGQNQIRLTWDENPEKDVVGYRIYKKTDPNASFIEIQPGANNNYVLVGTSFTDTNVSPNETYSYKVTAVDNYQYPVAPYRGLESAPTPDASGFMASTHDPDQDGLNDLQEMNLGTNPADSDTDNDYLKDGDEVNIHHTKPENPDSDNDGVNDYLEILAQTNPNNRNSKSLYLRNYTFATANNFQGITRTAVSYVQWTVANGELKATASRTPSSYSWATLPKLDLTGLSKFMISYDLTLNGTGGRLLIGNTQIELNLQKIGIVRNGRIRYPRSPFIQNRKSHVLVAVEKRATDARIKIWKDGVLILNELTPSRLVPNSIRFSSPIRQGYTSYDNIIISEVPNSHMYPFSWNFANGWGSWYTEGKPTIRWAISGGVIQAIPTSSTTGYNTAKSLLGDLTTKDAQLDCYIRYLNGARSGGLWLAGFQFDVNPAGLFCRDNSIPNNQIHRGISANAWHKVTLLLKKNSPAGPYSWSAWIDGQQKVPDEQINGQPKDQCFGFVSNNDRGQVQFKSFKITRE